MIKKIFLAVMLMVTFTANAQIAPLSSCVPITGPRIVHWTLGRHLVFVCTDSTRTIVYQDGLSCLHATCNVDGTAAAAQRITLAGLGGPAAFKAAIDLEWKAVGWDCSNPPGAPEIALCRERMNWIATWWADAIKDFKPAVWQVKVNGTSLTRPAYTLINGVLGTVQAGKATVGIPCDLTRPTYPASGGDIRAEFGTPNLVTICKKM